jgi:signal transduction histidine kinase/HAMP domain-containing protein
MGTGQNTAKMGVPRVGKRGGLGRTLLTTLLVLAVVPLSIVSWYATQRGRLNIQEEVAEKLASIADLKETQISRWVEVEASILAEPQFESQMNLALEAAETKPEEAQARLAAVAEQWGMSDLCLVSPEGQVRLASDAAWEGDWLTLPQEPRQGTSAEPVQTSLDLDEQARLVLISSFVGNDTRWPYVGARVPTGELTRILEETAGLGETGEVYLVSQSGVALPQGRRLSGRAVQAAIQRQHAEGLYENYEGTPVIGSYRWLPDLNLALFVEQSQQEALEGNNAVVAAVIAAALAVALVTAVIAAFIVRHITSPVVRLTESALRIAGGDLSQRVEITSRDEIGILAHVFNHMATELQVLYANLEEKVAERTRALQQANYQIQWRAIQMQASLEVGQAITSVLDPDELLEEVVRVVRDRFVYSYVAVYTIDDAEDAEDEHLHLRASGGQSAALYDQTSPGVPGAAREAFMKGRAAVESHPAPVTVGPPTMYTHSEVALPMRLGERTVGVLYVQSTDQEGFNQDDVSVLQNVANQITIALENARAYAVEREAAEQLRELDRSKRRFLANMSHELRTPLTNIIGFSRLMMKEINGPLSDRQRHDLEIIYDNGQHLLGLINDLLDISHIEAGLMELELREVDLAGLIRSVMATAGALVRDKEIMLREEIAPDLPAVQVDAKRIRQVLLRLLANAAKFTNEGTITVRARSADGPVVVSVTDTGVGIPPGDRERIFERFEQGSLRNERRPNGAGLGLALSKEFVEMHGGQIWVESEMGKGSTFAFSLPLEPPSAEQG